MVYSFYFNYFMAEMVGIEHMRNLVTMNFHIMVGQPKKLCRFCYSITDG